MQTQEAESPFLMLSCDHLSTNIEHLKEVPDQDQSVCQYTLGFQMRDIDNLSILSQLSQQAISVNVGSADQARLALEAGFTNENIVLESPVYQAKTVEFVLRNQVRTSILALGAD